MIKKIALFIVLLAPLASMAQDRMTPELLWKLGRVTGLGISKDGKYILYSVTTPDVESNKSKHKSYMVPLNGGASIEITTTDSMLNNKNVSPDGKHALTDKEVKVKKVFGSDYYPELAKSNAYIFE